MSYEYRQMTQEERAAVIESRRKRGYPLHAPPHPYREAGWYFLTASNFEHVPVMQAPGRRDGFEMQLLNAFGSVKSGKVVP